MYYPILIDMKGKEILVFGGGKIAYGKSLKILECGGHLTVVSKEFNDDFNRLQREYANLHLIEDEYREDYIESFSLIIAATNNSHINMQISSAAQSKNIMCNIVDNGEVSDFILPSTVRRGDLIISVSTSGNSPSLTKKIKRELEEKYPEEMERYVYLLGFARKKILELITDPKIKKKILNDLVHMSVKELEELNHKDWKEFLHENSSGN